MALNSSLYKNKIRYKLIEHNASSIFARTFLLKRLLD